MEEDRDKPFVGIYTGLALRRGELKRGLSVNGCEGVTKVQGHNRLKQNKHNFRLAANSTSTVLTS